MGGNWKVRPNPITHDFEQLRAAMQIRETGARWGGMRWGEQGTEVAVIPLRITRYLVFSPQAAAAYSINRTS